MRWILFLATLPAVAQIAVFAVDMQGVETRLENLYDMGSIAAGDTLEARVRLRNLATSTITLRSLRIAGADFSLANDPTPPLPVAPNSNVDFRIRFRPHAPGTYSAILQANERNLIVRAVSFPSLGVFLETSAGWNRVTNAAPIDFPRTETDSSSVLRLRVRNEATTRIALVLSALTGDFRFVDSPRLPIIFEPDTETIFQIMFLPTRPGIRTGTLRFDNRSFSLTGFAVDPPFPEPSFTLSSETLESGRPVKVGIRLAGRSRATGNGVLSLSFESSITGVSADPTIVFLPSGTRSVPVQVAMGQEVVTHSGNAEIALQTGSTAGILTLELRLGDQLLRRTYTIDSLPVKLDTTRMTRTPTGVEVMAVGFDNTRSAIELAFTFYHRNQRSLTPEPILVNPTESFARFFQSSSLGGVFQLKAQFPVAGDASLIGSVEIRIKNSIGTVTSARASY